jgi:pyruvate dehydrogenase E2 component (dihydrolipoamide acetyltransferase)
MANLTDVKVPDIGDYKDVPVIEVLVKDGDAVEKDATLLVLESDKATLEVPSPGAGIVRGLKLKANDKVSQGDLICQLEAADTAPAAKTEAVKPAAAKSAEAPKKPVPSGGDPNTASPSAGEGRTSPMAQPINPAPLLAGEGKADAQRIAVKIPDIGDYKDVPVIEVLVKDGDSVDKDATLLVLESDKATLEVPSPAAGVVRGLKLKANDKVSQGDGVCELETSSVTVAAPQAATPTTAAASAPVKSVPAAAPVTDAAPIPPPARISDAADVVYAGPATRKFARELGVDLRRLQGSGPRGRIVIEDVQGYVKKTLATPATVAPAAAAGGSGIPPIPAVDFSQFGAIEKKPLARIRKLSAAHLHRAWLNLPHVTQFDEADITEVEAFRKSSADETGVKLTLLPFIMKAVAKTMEAYPDFNSSLAPDGENLILKKYCHIGFAADTENGLVVPVIRDVDKKGVSQLAKECSELASRARDGKLKADDMKGGCFSISSLGGIGGSHFTPIVNAPEVAILGASRAQIKPVWDGKAFQPRLLLPLSLSYDHRVIDGAYAARFIVQLVRLLSDVRRLAL